MMKNEYKHKFKYLIGLEIQETVTIQCDDKELSDEIAVKSFLEQHVLMYTGDMDIVDKWFLENVKIWKKDEVKK